MTADPLHVVLSRLEKPREVAPGRWRARCPAHDGKNATALAITRGGNGGVLIHCFHGCEPGQVVAALGLQLADLMPPRPEVPGGGGKRMRGRFVPAQVFDVVRGEIAVAAVIASDMHQRRDISDGDHERLWTAARRLDEVARLAYGRP